VSVLDYTDDEITRLAKTFDRVALSMLSGVHFDDLSTSEQQVIPRVYSIPDGVPFSAAVVDMGLVVVVGKGKAVSL